MLAGVQDAEEVLVSCGSSNRVQQCTPMESTYCISVTLTTIKKLLGFHYSFSVNAPDIMTNKVYFGRA